MYVHACISEIMEKQKLAASINYSLCDAFKRTYLTIIETCYHHIIDVTIYQTSSRISQLCGLTAPLTAIILLIAYCITLYQTITRTMSFK